MEEPRPARATPRRAFLRVLALAPAAAACASAAGAKHPTAGGAASSTAGPARTSVAATPDALAPVRDFPLRADAEPAFVFRAAAARPGL